MLSSLDESMFRPVFGCSLEDHLRVNDREIPFVIEECVLYLLENALDVEVRLSILSAFAVTCVGRLGRLIIFHYLKKGRLCNTIASVALVHTSIQSDNRIRTKKYSQLVIQNKHSCKVAPKPVGQALAWCGGKEVLEKFCV